MTTKPFWFFLLTVCSSGFCTPGSGEEIDMYRPTSDPVSEASLNPWKGDFRTPQQVELAADEVYFPNTSGAKLRGWLFTSEGSRQTILFCMGNSGNISLMLPYAKILQDAGFEVLLFDYQGFGESEGIASVTSLLSDCTAALEFLINSRERAPKDIGVFGVSLGSVLALAIAAENETGPVAVEDVFIPNEQVDRLAARYFKKNDIMAKLAMGTLKSVFLGRVDPIANVKKIESPIFLMHGINDWLLPPAGTMKVAAACPGPTRIWLMSDTGHAPESLEVNDLEYASQLQTFFQQAFSDSLNEPEGRITSVSPTDMPRRVKVAVSVSCRQSDDSQPVQIAIADQQGRCEFHRRRLSGTQTLVIDSQFTPSHVSVVRFHNVMNGASNDWEPQLSSFSSALKSFRWDAHRLFGHERTCEYYFAKQGQLFYTNQRPLSRFPGSMMSDVARRLPAPDKIPERIRGRYAGLLARLDRWPRPPHLVREGNGLSDLPYAEKMVQYLPGQPDDYYEIGNARFQLKFRDAVVAHSLFELAKRRLIQNKPQEAQQLLRQHLAVLPTFVPTDLTVDRIASIQTLEDLQPTLGRN